MGWRVLAAALRFLLLAARPLRRSEEVWGWVDIVLPLVTAVGLVGGAGLAGAFGPNLASGGPRWMLVTTYSAIVAVALCFVAGVRLQMRVDRYKPKLAIRAITRQGEPEYACLEATNLGEERVKACTGYLFSIEIETDSHGPHREADKHPTYLQWSSKDGGGKEVTFTTQAALDVAELSGKVFPLVVLDSEQRSQYRLVGGYSYLLDVEVSSENAGRVRRRYRLKAVDSGYGVDTWEEVNSA